MCFIVARNADKTGCIAMRTQHGPELVNLKRRIISQKGYSKIQLMTISRPSAYEEYAPYHIVDTVEEFMNAVLQL